jgi:hypothetical protein
MRLARRAGFSLMEILLVAVLLPVVGLAIFSNFNSGLKLWRSIGTPDPNEDRTIFFGRVERDLEQGFKSKAAPFTGSSGTFSLSTIVEGPEGLGGADSPGRAVFSYDAAGRAIVREAFDANQISEEKPGTKTAAARDVASAHFSYLVFDKERQRFEWREEVEADKLALPAAVRFEMELLAPDGALEPVSRVFYIPAGD